MKALFYVSMKPLTTFLLLFGVMMFSSSDIFAQEKPGTPSAQEKLSGAPRARKVSKAELAKAAFGQSVQPAERVKGDHAACGISLRNRGGGVFNLRGVPQNSQPVKAYLYWDILTDRADQNMSISLNGVSVQGVLICQGDSPCWAPAYNFVYRAKIPLYLLYNGINGDYKIAGIPSGEGFGMSPWEAATPPLAEGATLVVFYRNPNSIYKTTYIFEKPVCGQMFGGFPGETFSATLTGFSPAPQNTAKFTLVGADGQIGFAPSGLSASYNTTAETSFFQGTQIAGPPDGGTSSNADSDWNGHDPEPLNQLWDTRTHIVPIKPNSTSAGVKYTAPFDCLVVVVFLLGL